jgi:MoaA/NifB/PqqE/SkfB family radical SAM enzyme
MKKSEVAAAWGSILLGRIPVLSIEITRECPLSCPGCYAYGDSHLGGGVTLNELADFRGDDLVNGLIGLARKHKPLHISLVGGEPLVRHKELSRTLPVLNDMRIFTMIVTSAVIPIPAEWMQYDRVRVTVSVDGLQPDHDVRRKPATYEKILKNISGRHVNVHWTITRQMTERPGYFEEFLAYWSAMPEVLNIWFSLYTPQIGEQSAEMLTREQRISVSHELAGLKKKYSKLLMHEGLAEAYINPPESPRDCTFAKMSVNYSADLKSRVEPCIFGGNPDCSQCGCTATAGLHWVADYNLMGPLKAGHIMNASLGFGNLIDSLRAEPVRTNRWRKDGVAAPAKDLIQIRQ